MLLGCCCRLGIIWRRSIGSIEIFVVSLGGNIKLFNVDSRDLCPRGAYFNFKPKQLKTLNQLYFQPERKESSDNR